jgi:hypothetical protein
VVRVYRNQLASYAGMRALEVWYSRVDAAEIIALSKGRRRRAVTDRLARAQHHTNLDTLDPAELAPYGRLCGWVLARAHARSGDGAAISGYLGTGDRFDRAVADFAEAYADQTEADYAAFTRARGSAPAEGGRGGGTNQRKGDGG